MDANAHSSGGANDHHGWGFRAENGGGERALLFFERGLLFCSRAVVLGVEGVMMAVLLLEETSADLQPAES